ncbi:hypothetical protein GWI33_010722, partial [Rhynchophorus ferrugineus]
MRPDLPFEMRRLLAMHFVRPRSIFDMRRTLSQIPLHLPRQQPEATMPEQRNPSPINEPQQPPPSQNDQHPTPS